MALWLNQIGVRRRDDTADENEDAGWLGPLNEETWAQPVDTAFRIRFHMWYVDRFAVAHGGFMIYYSHNGGDFTYLDNADEVKTTDSILHAIDSSVPGYVEGDDSTILIAPGDYTWVDNNNGITESDASGDSMTWPLDVDAEAEFEWCLTLRDSQVQPGDTIELKLYWNDSDITFLGGAYTQPCLFTVAAPVVETGVLNLKGAPASIRGGTLSIKGG